MALVAYIVEPFLRNNFTFEVALHSKKAVNAKLDSLDFYRKKTCYDILCCKCSKKIIETQ